MPQCRQVGGAPDFFPTQSHGGPASSLDAPVLPVCLGSDGASQLEHERQVRPRARTSAGFAHAMHAADPVDTVVRELLEQTAEGDLVRLSREDQLACFGG